MLKPYTTQKIKKYIVQTRAKRERESNKKSTINIPTQTIAPKKTPSENAQKMLTKTNAYPKNKEKYRKNPPDYK